MASFEPDVSRTSAQTSNWLAFLSASGIHPKLSVSSPGDADEREADAVTERVMRMAAPALSSTNFRAQIEPNNTVGRSADTRTPVPRDLTSAAQAVSSGGSPLGTAERAFFEPRLDRELGGVRVHTDSPTQRAADGIGARAFAHRGHIGFAAGEFQPGTAGGRRLLAHELAHIVLDRQSGAGSKAGGKSAGGQSAPDGRSGSPGTTISRQVPVPAPAGPVAAPAPPVPGAPFNDPVAWSSDVEAAKAMRVYQALPLAERRKAVADSYQHDLIRVLRALSAIDKTTTFKDSLREIGRFAEELETQSSAGMTDDQIAGEQAKFVIAEAKAAANAKAAAAAAAAKKPVVPPTPAEIEAERKSTVAANSSVTPPVVGWWTGLSAAEKTNWTNRGNAAITKVVALATAKNPELGVTAANFNLDYEKTEKRGGNVIAAGSPALVGKRFVETAELNPAYVMDIVVHEVFGHPEYGKYGSEYHMDLYDKASAKVPGYVKPAAGTADRTQELDAFAYQETEIYAVLRSMPFRTAPTPADKPKVPNLDTQALVDSHVATMKQQWSPTLIVAIMRGLLKRLIIDPRIGGPAIGVFRKAVTATFDAATAAAILK